ncbi:hypothetical protein [Citrobacter sp. RHB21-C01]|uniref:hypothetical protein n=1 Tax=Citrobacter sp. RHB21-C01 TaxID=2742622 RepID=UPI0034D5C1C5
MDNDIIGLWEKIELPYVNDKEKAINDFLTEFTLMEFWIECEEHDGTLGFVLTEATEDDLKSLLFAYPADRVEELPELLANAINKGGKKFHKFDGASLLGILHGIGCSLMIVSSEQKFVCIKKDIIDKFYIALTGDVNSGNNSGISQKWFWAGIAVIILLCFLGGKFYLDSYPQIPTINLSELSWRIAKIDVAKGDFSVELPFNYETDGWKKDLAYELQSGKVFRVYKSNDAVFRNHIINIGFIPSRISLSESMSDLDAETSLMLTAMQKKIGRIKNKQQRTC